MIDCARELRFIGIKDIGKASSFGAPSLRVGTRGAASEALGGAPNMLTIRLLRRGLWGILINERVSRLVPFSIHRSRALYFMAFGSEGDRACEGT